MWQFATDCIILYSGKIIHGKENVKTDLVFCRFQIQLNGHYTEILQDVFSGGFGYLYVKILLLGKIIRLGNMYLSNLIHMPFLLIYLPCHGMKIIYSIYFHFPI